MRDSHDIKRKTSRKDRDNTRIINNSEKGVLGLEVITITDIVFQLFILLFRNRLSIVIRKYIGSCQLFKSQQHLLFCHKTNKLERLKMGNRAGRAQRNLAMTIEKINLTLDHVQRKGMP